jgi:hypothetical protein
LWLYGKYTKVGKRYSFSSLYSGRLQITFGLRRYDLENNKRNRPNDTKKEAQAY